MRAFNKPTNVTFSEWIEKLDYSFSALCNRIYNKSLIESDIEKIKALPNFDAKIFKEITGIDIDEQ